jgi:hypothetical protein
MDRSELRTWRYLSLSTTCWQHPINAASGAKYLQSSKTPPSRPWTLERWRHGILAARLRVSIWLFSNCERSATAAGRPKSLHGAADSRLQRLRNPYAMEGIMGGRACAKPRRTWASRAAVRAESRREQQFYRFVCLLGVDEFVCFVCCADSSRGTMVRSGRRMTMVLSSAMSGTLKRESSTKRYHALTKSLRPFASLVLCV